MELTRELVSAYQEIAMNPARYGLVRMRPFTECFEKTSVVTAKHLLFKEYVTNEQPLMPKLIFYIIMNNLYGMPFLKDENGLLGYDLRFTIKNNPEEAAEV